jgi:DNA polymerase elongation subunit (family B)
MTTFIEPVDAQKYFLSLPNPENVWLNYNNGVYNFEEKEESPGDEIISIEEIGYSEENYVYDIETEDGTFHAGVGSMIVKNTDSIYTVFKIKNQDKMGKEELLNKIWDVSEECAKRISDTFKKPIELELEKQMWPLYLYGKKRYSCLYYEKKKDGTFSSKIDLKGVQTVRRDNCQLVKSICNPIFDKLLYDQDTEGAMDIARKWIKELLNNKVNIKEFILSKSLKSSYKETNKNGRALPKPAHWFLAEKLKKRDPMTAPKGGDRVPYIFIENKDKNALQSDRVENPEYILAHPETCVPDVMYYLDRQIESPLFTIFEVLVKDKNGNIFTRKIMNDGKEVISKECKEAITSLLWGEAKRKKMNQIKGNNEITNWFKPATKSDTKVCRVIDEESTIKAACKGK